MSYGLTPSQTVGPFHSIGLRGTDWPFVVPEGTPGAIWLRGTLTDGDGEPVPDGVIETWQADPDGRFDHAADPRGARKPAVPGFRGFGRSETLEGRWAIHTVKPGPVPEDVQASAAEAMDACPTGAIKEG